MLHLAMAALHALASVTDTSWNEGVSTQFEGVGVPYGACGVPDSVAWRLSTPDGRSVGEGRVDGSGTFVRIPGSGAWIIAVDGQAKLLARP